MTTELDYRTRYERVLLPLAASLGHLLNEHLAGISRIDRVSARAKTINSFVRKSENTTSAGERKYDNPLAQIQDQIGARVTVFYKSDVISVRNLLMSYLHPVESKDLVPQSEWEFGYFGWHAVCLFPSELIMPDWPSEHVPKFFELQVKTLFQHAWSEANHDLGYKPDGSSVSPDHKRMLAYASAQAWGADRAFDELARDLEQAPH